MATRKIKRLDEERSIISQYISELRDINIQSDRQRFRLNLRRCAQCMAYEISKSLQYDQKDVETPLGSASVMVPTDRVVVSSILRAGLPMHEGMLDVFDRAHSAFISSYRRHHKDGSFEISLDYLTSPELDDAVLILCDPMIATGSSIENALEALMEEGTPQKIFIVSIIASADGLDRISRLYPKADIWVGAVDEELTARAYIVPGLGDAGDLAFGEKSKH